MIDETQDVARAYGAVCTPDFFGFDRDLKLVYRGRLDASGRSPDPTARRASCSTRWRTSRARGRAPAVQHPAVGCSIKWSADEVRIGHAGPTKARSASSTAPGSSAINACPVSAA